MKFLPGLSPLAFKLPPFLARATLLIALQAAVAGLAAAAAPAEGGWSAELLNQILKREPVPGPAAAKAPAAAEVVLHTYHLSHLKVAEAGRTQTVLTLLHQLLPAGSSINPDVPANSLHILTTPAAHKAVWDYLSAVDVPEPAPAAAAPGVPEEVKTALTKLAANGDQSGRLLAALNALQSGVTQEMAAIDARQQRQTLRLVGGAAALGLVVLATMGWILRRRAPAAAPESAALVLAPEQLATALVPVQDKMRTDMLGLLNEVAIKLQAQHHEQQKLVREQQQQLDDARQALADERRQFITEAGSMVVQAVERVDATTAKLARQQDKVAELVQELQHTVRELDETKDSLRDREVELEQERAKIAALSLLLEDGSALPAGAFANGHSPATHAPGANSNHDNHGPAPSRLAATTPCTTPDHTHPKPSRPANDGPLTPPQFRFLPPDAPET